jgi:hypothetical protein
VREILDGDVSPSPLNGDLSSGQLYQGEISLLTRPISEERVRNYLEPLLVDGRYPMGEIRMKAMSDLIAACRDAGVQLVFFEIPLSEILMRNLPEGTYDEFLDRMWTLAGEGAAWFVTVDDLQLVFDDSDFAEQSHLNLAGARKLTRALTERVIVPELEEVDAD